MPERSSETEGGRVGSQSDKAQEQTHVAALAATKLADGLIDPKLVLAWLLNAIGAPGFLIGILVPVREAGSLLPQLALARHIERRRIRKPFWAGGSAIQGMAALGIAAAAIALPGTAAGWVILGLLAVLAVARAACSSSYKDILARTVPKGRRGSVSGTAGTIGAGGVLVFALCLGADILPRTTGSISVVIACAGLLWIAAAFIFLRLDEPETDPEPDSDFQLEELVKPLQQDEEFRTYIGTRALMISTALAPPFLVMLGGQSSETGVANLGMLMLASSIAAITSSYIWGRFSDRSSRKTLMTSGALCAAILGLAAALGGLGDNPISSWVLASLLFLAQLAYQGARAGRKTHLTDMDTHGHTSLYTALSNSMIGVLLLCGGAFGWLADVFGPALVLAVLATMAGAGAALGARLSEVQDDPS